MRKTGNQLKKSEKSSHYLRILDSATNVSVSGSDVNKKIHKIEEVREEDQEFRGNTEAQDSPPFVADGESDCGADFANKPQNHDVEKTSNLDANETKSSHTENAAQEDKDTGNSMLEVLAAAANEQNSQKGNDELESTANGFDEAGKSSFLKTNNDAKTDSPVMTADTKSTPPDDISQTDTAQSTDRKLQQTSATRKVTRPPDLDHDLQCYICSRMFTNTDLRDYHVKHHDTMRYTCPKLGCGHMFHDRRGLKNHIRMRKDHGDLYESDIFTKSCTKPLSLSSRKQQSYSKSKRLVPRRGDKGSKTMFKCPVKNCGIIFQSWSDYHTHYLLIHYSHHTLLRKAT